MRCDITIKQDKFPDGRDFISVDFNAKNYGAGSPCSNEEEVQSAINRDIEWIKREGDTYRVVDLRKPAGLKGWL